MKTSKDRAAEALQTRLYNPEAYWPISPKHTGKVLGAVMAKRLSYYAEA